MGQWDTTSSEALEDSSGVIKQYIFILTSYFGSDAEKPQLIEKKST